MLKRYVDLLVVTRIFRKFDLRRRSAAATARVSRRRKKKKVPGKVRNEVAVGVDLWPNLQGRKDTRSGKLSHRIVCQAPVS